MDFELTAKQEKGSKFLLECYMNKRPGFLQAVCGAGKTEMTLKVILTAINMQQRVCFVLPRVTVLKELHDRFQSYFPHTIIKALYEGNKDYENANILLSTPQQMIYFYQEFDLVIIDEVDAFPYADNPFLKRLVMKSIAPYGSVLYMSATISKEFQWLIKQKKIDHCVIPSRYHMRPMIEPIFMKITHKKQMLEELRKRIDGVRQSIVFVPTLATGESLLEQLRSQNLLVEFISSQSKETRRIITGFRRKEYRVLIATTVLERGVTFRDIDCIVYLADHKVFSKETLVQISGRVDRTPRDTSGEVLFYSTYISKAMKEAKKEIGWMNRQHEMQTL